ncbi:hypothetical protein [Micromonospora sp. NPDC050200]|uniref:hypothetical protein n=1 Tax=Micromonospora sp. NPDC050200 TaxID=3155664 RepID=UPI0033C1B28A
MSIERSVVEVGQEPAAAAERAGRRAQLISIPTQAKINAAYDGGGMPLLVCTIEGFTRVRADPETRAEPALREPVLAC